MAQTTTPKKGWLLTIITIMLSVNLIFPLFPGTQQTAIAAEVVILEAYFDSSADGFIYLDDSFRGTSASGYADGELSAGSLQVTLGGIDDADILGMSGGWEQSFTLSETTDDVTISFLYNLTQASDYESDEYSQVLVSVDGSLYGQGSNDYVAQITGNGNGGSAETTGWQPFEVNLGTLAGGNYTFVIGGYNNKKTYNNESTEVLIDEVRVVGMTSVPDTTSPSPDPMTWVTVPYATGSNSISMTAATASDPSGVEYYFDCSSGGCNDSGWQDSTTYTDTGLQPETTYSYQVKARDKSPDQNETGWSTEEFTTTETPSADVEIIGSWVSGTSHAEEPGYSRALLFFAHVEDNDTNMNLSSVSYGGRAMTKITERNVGTGYRAYVAAYILNDAGIVNSTNSTFSLTWASTPSRTPAYSSVFLENVKQADPIGAIAANGTSSSNTLATSALATSMGDMVFVAGTCGNTGTYSVNNGFTEAIELSPTSADGVAGYKLATGASETPSITHSNVNRQVVIGLVVQSGEPAPPDIEPPSPDPMTWATVPYATGPNSISMTAATASDPSGVEYYFYCTSAGCNDSGWQDSTTYTDTGLQPETTYSYQVKARDKSPSQNETGLSAEELATTEATIPQVVILEANFDTDADGFTYFDDTFRSTSEPNYAAGGRLASGGFSGGALQVIVGGIDTATVLGMSGGFQRNITLNEPVDAVFVSFRYNLTQASDYESDEYSQALMSINGTLYGQGLDDYVAQITGNGNGGSAESTGWQLFQANLGAMAAGNHTLTIGGYNNKKTYNNESTEILIDEMLISLEPPEDPTAGATALVARLDYHQFKQNIQTLSDFGDRTQGSSSYAAADAWLEQQLTAAGYTVERHFYTYSGSSRSSMYVTKVGTKFPDQMYMVSAHLDGRSGGGAADDDGSGVSLVLEAARVMAQVDVETDISVRFIFWNNEETRLNGSNAYVADRAGLQGTAQEPTWLGIIQHDMILYDHGLPPQVDQIPGADIDIEYEDSSSRAAQSLALATTLQSRQGIYFTDYPAEIGPNMSNTDSVSFENYTAAVSIRENQRGTEIGNGSNPYYHTAQDLFENYSENDFRFGFNTVQMTIGTVAELAGAKITSGQ